MLSLRSLKSLVGLSRNTPTVALRFFVSKKKAGDEVEYLFCEAAS